VTVDVHRLDEGEYEEPQPDSYEALRIVGEIIDPNYSVADEERFKRELRPLLYMFTLTGCYNLDAATAAGEAEHKDMDPEPVPAQVDSAAGGVASDEPESEIDDSPYLINKTDLIKDSQPSDIRMEEKTIEFTFQLGPTWVRWGENR